jgi:hypothetical protein
MRCARGAAASFSHVLWCGGRRRHHIAIRQARVLALLMVRLLELVVELDPEEAVFEVLHELLVVNPLRTVNVGGQSKSDDLAFIESQRPELGQALYVFERLQEALVILIKLAEYLKEVQVGVLRHIHVVLPESAQLHKLCLAPASLDREHLWDDFAEQAIKVIDIDFTIVVVIGQAEDQIDLARCQGQLLGVAYDRADVLY